MMNLRTSLWRQSCRSVRLASRPASSASGGFGEEERQAKGREPVKDSAPYQNEVTKSGTNSEVAHHDESYDGGNTDPEESNRRQGESLDSSPANKHASRDARKGTSNKTERTTADASGYKTGNGGSQGNQATQGTGNQGTGSSGQSAESKFDNMGLGKGHDDPQQVGGRKVTN